MGILFYGVRVGKKKHLEFVSSVRLQYLGKQTSLTKCISKFTNMDGFINDNKPLRVAFCHPDLGLGGKLADDLVS